ncbi:MAG: DUF2177 family protein [Hyphomicrobiales bacterium]
MTRYALAYVVTLAVFLAIDLVWLTKVARGLYVAEMGDLLRAQPMMGAAIVFYLLYAAGLVFFAVEPGLRAQSVVTAAGLGAALGLIAYGTYDLTNLAVLKGYSVRIGLIDLAWGTLLSGVTAAIATAVVSVFTAR